MQAEQDCGLTSFPDFIANVTAFLDFCFSGYFILDALFNRRARSRCFWYLAASFLMLKYVCRWYSDFFDRLAA
jgi:hypothetical protein